MTHKRLLLCSAALSVAVLFGGIKAVSAASGRFPRSIYPPAVSAASGGALTRCPNGSGVGAFPAALRADVRRIALTYAQVNQATDMRNSDPAWWPQIRRMWKSPSPSQRGVAVRKIEPASHSPYAAIVRRSCGASVLRLSIAATAVPRAQTGKSCAACAITLFFLDRRDHLLIYYVH